MGMALCVTDVNLSHCILYVCVTERGTRGEGKKIVGEFVFTVVSEGQLNTVALNN